MMSTWGVTLPLAWKTEQTETLGANVVRACALRGGNFDFFIPFSLAVWLFLNSGGQKTPTVTVCSDIFCLVDQTASLY